MANIAGESRETSWFCFPSSLGKTKLTVSLGTIHLVNNISHRHFFVRTSCCGKICFSRQWTILNSLLHESQLRYIQIHAESRCLIRLLKQTLQTWWSLEHISCKKHRSLLLLQGQNSNYRFRKNEISG